MRKRIEREFKAYSIRNAIRTTMNAVNMQTITNDIGDDFSKRPEVDLDNYDYDEESTEPAAAKLDSHGVQGRMADPKEPQNRFTIEQFNLLLHAIRDGRKTKESSDAKGRRRTYGSPGKLSIPSISALRADAPSSASRRGGRASSMSNASKRLRSDQTPAGHYQGGSSSDESPGRISKQRMIKSDPYEIPADEEEMKYRKEQEEQHRKLQDFLKFKA